MLYSECLAVIDDLNAWAQRQREPIATEAVFLALNLQLLASRPNDIALRQAIAENTALLAQMCRDRTAPSLEAQKKNPTGA
jgi:hypothetical protein